MQANESSRQLTPQELKRLRGTINVSVLERLLAMAPANARGLILLLCSKNVSDSELKAAGFPISSSISKPTFKSPSDFRVRSEQKEGPGVPIEPVKQIHLSFKFEDPDLQALWERVEPG
jgi:hypothetical protein